MDKKLILFIPGLWGSGHVHDGSSWCFEPWQEVISHMGYKSLVLNTRREDTLSHTAEHTITEYILNVKNRIQSLGDPTKIVLVGHSMGGLIAQKIAELYSLGGVVLVSSAPPRGINALHWELMSRIWRYMPDMLMNEPFIPNKQDATDLLFSRCENPDKLYEKLVPENGYLALKLATISVQVSDKLRCPSLVVGGKHDRLLPLSIQLKIAKKYGSNYANMDCGHVPMLEKNNEKFITEIMWWIERFK